MAEQWIIKVQGKEFGPADFATLQEWKEEGRVIRTNEARVTDSNTWTVASEIPGLFETELPPVQREIEPPRPPRSVREILAQTLSIYRRGFWSFLCLTLLVVSPSICAQVTGAFIGNTSGADMDLGKAAVAGFAACMMILSWALRPLYITGIQILSAELNNGNRVGFLSVLNASLRYWPRVTALCVIVYGVFLLLYGFLMFILVLTAFGQNSIPIALLVLLLVVVQVGLFGRWFVNTMFWQQTAVLENADPAQALRSSRDIARSKRDLPWFRRPLWRGALLASIWIAFELSIQTAAAWPMLQKMVHDIGQIQDPNAILEAMKAAQNNPSVDIGAAVLGLFKWILRPLLGIAFVVLYFDSRIPKEEEQDEKSSS